MHPSKDKIKHPLLHTLTPLDPDQCDYKYKNHYKRPCISLNIQMWYFATVQCCY